MKKYKLDKEVFLQTFVEFKKQGELRFILFNFRNYFDGLIGLNILSQLGAKIDLVANKLITKNATIPLEFKPNFSSGKHIIPSNSKVIKRIPVDIQEGDIYVKETYITDCLLIPEGIYHAKD